MYIGVMNDPAKPVYEEVLAIGRAGYDFVDLTIEGPNAREISVDRMLSTLEQGHLFVVGHTDPCLPYAYPIPSVREVCFRELERCAQLFTALGARIMNIHPCYACPPKMRLALVELNITALKSIVAMADSYGLTVVFENYKAPFDRVATFQILLQEVPGLQVHLDFGHANLGKNAAEDFCRRLGSQIKHVHFSDNRSIGDDHIPLGAGNIDWRSSVNALKACGYDGTVTLEIFANESAVFFQYLDVSRRFLLDLWNRPG
ncbi:MAG: sugar phosphate isomerase/epimerase [Desulfobacterales bacterium]|nr:MAG: sugar phosphate isomerase/epimerase [Desulfobacterales bacterium]